MHPAGAGAGNGGTVGAGDKTAAGAAAAAVGGGVMNGFGTALAACPMASPTVLARTRTTGFGGVLPTTGRRSSTGTEAPGLLPQRARAACSKDSTCRVGIRVVCQRPSRCDGDADLMRCRLQKRGRRGDVANGEGGRAGRQKGAEATVSPARGHESARGRRQPALSNRFGCRGWRSASRAAHRRAGSGGRRVNSAELLLFRSEPELAARKRVCVGVEGRGAGGRSGGVPDLDGCHLDLDTPR